MTTETENAEHETAATKPAKRANTLTHEEANAFLSMLKDENATYREKLRNLTAENEKYKADVERMSAEHAEALSQQATAFKISNARADLIAKAVKAGLNDVSDMDHYDMDQVEIGDDGKVKDAEKVIEKLQKAKPHYFGSASTSSIESSPAVESKVTKGAYEMDDKQWEAKKRSLGL